MLVRFIRRYQIGAYSIEYARIRYFRNEDEMRHKQRQSRLDSIEWTRENIKAVISQLTIDGTIEHEREFPKGENLYLTSEDMHAWLDVIVNEAIQMENAEKVTIEIRTRKVGPIELWAPIMDLNIPETIQAKREGGLL